MTESSNKKSKDKRYRRDFVRSKTSPTVAPLADFPDDEDAIDRLLLNTGFDTDNEDELAIERNILINEPVNFEKTEEFSKFEAVWDIEPELKVKDTDAVQSIASSEPVQNWAGDKRIDEISNTMESDIKIKSDVLLHGTDNELDISPIEFEIEDNLHEPREMDQDIQLAALDAGTNRGLSTDTCEDIDDEAITVTFNRFKSDQESINRQQAKLIGILEAKAKRTRILIYATLGISITAIIAAFALVMTAVKDTQKEISRLSDLISVIEEDMAGLNEKNFGNEAGENDSFLDPLSQAPKTDSAVQAQAIAIDKLKPTATSEQTKPKPDWYVNLISFKQRSDADSQAAEFMKKGVRTEIIEVEVNNATWYRLRVGGFIYKDQAAAYAEKIKKSLQLNSIWVAGS